MKKPAKILLALVAIVVVIVGGLAIFVATLDADKYRPQITAALEKQTGRKVDLNGPISFSLGFGGVAIGVQNVAIGNPAWASRPNMATVGKFTVGVGLLPLLAHRIAINELDLENADILLETNGAGQHNWDFGNPANAQPAAQTASSSPSSGPGVAVSVDKLSVTDSKLAMRDATGAATVYQVSSLTLGMHGAGAELKFKGAVVGTPVDADIETGLHNLLGTASFPFDASITYGKIHFTAKGSADTGKGTATVDTYKITSGDSTITGNVKASWARRVTISGVLDSDRLNLADFKAEPSGAQASAPAAAAGGNKSGGGRIFSTAPLPLAALRGADADMKVSIGDFVMGQGDLKNLAATLSLHNGDLVIAPARADIGKTPVDMQVKLNAGRSPAALTLGLKASGVDLGALQKLGGMKPFMSGSASADIELSGAGDSPHALASSLDGVITITAANGTISTGAASDISSLLGKLFNPSGGDAALNCLAARFIAKGGILQSNGILIDSAPTTVAGSGSVNLDNETVDLVLRAKTKLVDVGGLVPPVDITGSLASPGYSIAAASVVKNVVSSLASGNIDLGASGVPDIQSAPAGQNACVYTLDHPKAAASGSGVLPAGIAGKAQQQINNIGNALKGLFGQ